MSEAGFVSRICLIASLLLGGCGCGCGFVALGRSIGPDWAFGIWSQMLFVGGLMMGSGLVLGFFVSTPLPEKEKREAD